MVVESVVHGDALVAVGAGGGVSEETGMRREFTICILLKKGQFTRDFKDNSVYIPTV